MNEYKVKQLEIMLACELDHKNGGYGAHLSYWYGDSKPINIDAGALRFLIDYYKREAPHE